MDEGFEKHIRWERRCAAAMLPVFLLLLLASVVCPALRGILQDAGTDIFWKVMTIAAILSCIQEIIQLTGALDSVERMEKLQKRRGAPQGPAADVLQALCAMALFVSLLFSEAAAYFTMAVSAAVIFGTIFLTRRRR